MKWKCVEGLLSHEFQFLPFLPCVCVCAWSVFFQLLAKRFGCLLYGFGLEVWEILVILDISEVNVCMIVIEFSNFPIQLVFSSQYPSPLFFTFLFCCLQFKSFFFFLFVQFKKPSSLWWCCCVVLVALETHYTMSA